MKQTDKELDGNNFLVAYDVAIAKTGIQQYTREEIGDTTGDPKQLVNVYRDPSTFKDEKLLETFNGIPIVYRHPDNGKVDNNNFRDFVVGSVSGVYFKNGDLFAKKLTIIDKEAIVNVLSKQTNELSIGFRGTIEKSNGTFNGVPYEFKEDVIHANHLALCETGKAGAYYAINSVKKGSRKMDMTNEKADEKDCMNEGDIVPPHIQAHIEQVVKKKMAGVKPFLKDEEEKAEPDYMDKKNESEAEKKLLDSSDPELEKSEHKDKDLIQALKNSNNTYKVLLNKKDKEISTLELNKLELERALAESNDMVRNLAKRVNSSNLVNAMTGPDEMPSHYSMSREANGSLSKAFLLK